MLRLADKSAPQQLRCHVFFGQVAVGLDVFLDPGLLVFRIAVEQQRSITGVAREAH